MIKKILMKHKKENELKNAQSKKKKSDYIRQRLLDIVVFILNSLH